MLILILGLILFLGVHSFSMSRRWRAKAIDLMGLRYYKLSYMAKSFLGLGLIIWGFIRYRHAGLIMVWNPPYALHYLNFALTWLALVSLFSMGSKPGKIRGLVRHPMITAVKFWALAHLLVNGDLGGMLLFGSFLAWAVADRISLKKRGDYGAPRNKKFTPADLQAGVLGSAIYAAIIFLHPYLFGVPVING
ncbi:MAG TPA: NnrU family protein [Acidocella sp.]|nr:MAG: NnrU family protein [Acidocella sp. 20-61-6]HQT40268.1 NnrU family protein [Acidocella sp.]